MNMKKRILTGLPYLLKLMKLFILIVLVYEHIPNEINKFIGNKSIKSNIFRLQAYDSIMCRYYCIEFVNYMIKGKTLLDYTNLFSLNDFKKNDQIIKRIFKNE